ncbi:hypothetical protein [Yoonia sp. I 8.24]|uniref:hypothetical protein n=1 Tax=Yoonia sp. I 8.24 TaxID=1537229 RepID=UPI001EDD5446|nr:hypothetical protein [Yoonia sp. I 8.24]MCG3266699.1 hypothetical protein [Yoonia sp. I 8.24]
MAKFVPLTFWVTLAVYLALALVPFAELAINWLSETFPSIGPVIDGVKTTRLIASIVSGVVSLFVISQGWRLVWKIPYLKTKLSKALFYDLNGDWTAELQSNWPIVEKTKDAALNRGDVFDVFDDESLPDLCELSFDVTIKQSWFRTDVEFFPNDSTPLLVSKTVSVEFFKAENGTKSMAWVFEVKNKSKNGARLAITDEQSYLGAAKLNLNEDGSELAGEFWQNRSWHRGLNAAGLIVLKRKR